MTYELKNENKITNARFACAEAIKWLDCANTIISQNHKPYPEIACALLCLSTEISIKSLLIWFSIKYTKKGHNIKELFNLLPKEVKENIEKEYNKISQNKIEAIEIPNKIKYKEYNNFSELLDVVSEYGFNYYRYVFEKFDKDHYLIIYYQGMNALCKACYIVCENIVHCEIKTEYK